MMIEQTEPFKGIRRSGRTLAMVRQLPASGSVVIVHNSSMVSYIKEMIADVLGADVLKATAVRLVTNRGDANRALAGRRVPVFVDHAFWEQASPDTTAQVDMHIRSIRAAMGR